jgi:hypothetical protein
MCLMDESLISVQPPGVRIPWVARRGFRWTDIETTSSEVGSRFADLNCDGSRT